MQEKVINTRVSEELYEKISEKAKKHRTTISNLIRGLVEDTLEVYADVTDIIDQKIKDKLGKDETLVGYQDYMTAKDVKCFGCETLIVKGSKAYMAISKHGLVPEVVICENCMKNI